MSKQAYTVPLSAIIKEASLEVIHMPCNPDERMITAADVNRPGLALSGYFDFFDSERIQVLGKNEHSFLENLPHDLRESHINELVSTNPPAVILARELEILPELLDACRRYYDMTGRRIHFEYAMIDGVNDTPEAAKELLRRMKGLPAHFNLIPLNHVEESPLKPSSKAAVANFQKILEDGGITATVRRTLGGDIDASCGQLRRKHQKNQA